MINRAPKSRREIIVVELFHLTITSTPIPRMKDVNASTPEDPNAQSIISSSWKGKIIDRAISLRPETIIIHFEYIQFENKTHHQVDNLNLMKFIDNKTFPTDDQISVNFLSIQFSVNIYI